MSEPRRSDTQMSRLSPDQPPPEVLPALEADRAALAHEALTPELPDSLFDSIAADTVDRSPGPVERLREAPTPLRLAGGALALAGLIGMAAGLMGIRPDETWADATRVVVLLLALGGLATAALTVALRGYHARPLGSLAWVIIGVSLGVPAVLALWPGLWATGAAPAAAGSGHVGLPMCLIVGALMALAAMGVVWLFQREGRGTAFRLAAAAAAGGLTAFAALQLHCPSHDVHHLLFEHAAPGFLVAGAALLVGTWRSRRRR